jgi:hypothetical protein
MLGMAIQKFRLMQSYILTYFIQNETTAMFLYGGPAQLALSPSRENDPRLK